jgi:transcriptional regulator PpsR
VKPFNASDPAFEELDARSAAALLAVGGDIALVVDDEGVVRDVALADDERKLDESNRWVGRSWSDLVTPETRIKISTLIKEATTRGVSRRRQVNHALDSGEEVPVTYAAVRVGRAGQLVAVGRDMRHVAALQQRLVEAQQAMERDYWKLRHVETRYRLLFQMASDGILVLDASTMKVLDANGAVGQIFGEVPDRIVGRTFPFGMDAETVRRVEELVTAARNAGRAGDIPVSLADDARRYHMSASCFRQEQATLLLVRVTSADAPSASADRRSSLLMDLIERSPDAFVLTDLDGYILTANRAFLDLAEAGSEEQVRGTLLSTYVGRPGADFPVFVSMLKKNGVVRLIATSARGSHGSQAEVEVSAVWVPEGEDACIGFSLRDIGRRLAGGPQGARDLTRAVEELTALVGRVSLRDLVRDTVDLVERHFIEAALELTNDNRTSAAEVLGVSRQSLYVKLRRHRLAAADSDRESDTLS